MTGVVLLYAVEVATGATVDIVTITPTGRVLSLSGTADRAVAPMAEAYRARGLPPEDLADALEGWSDGRLQLDSAPPPVPATPLDLPEAVSDRHLRRYWTRGKGALKIGWGRPGDFAACVRHLRKYVRDPKGLCAVYHKAATGVWPGPGAHGGRRSKRRK